MIEAIIFSKNRAAQLDLLLRSITARAPFLFNKVSVIYTASSSTFNDGYEVCRKQHPQVHLLPQGDFEEQVMLMLNLNFASNEVCFLCDDDVFTRVFSEPAPSHLLKENRDVLCVSLRLGTNTTECYPLRRAQEDPEWTLAMKDLRFWVWYMADADWGYPGSLDGHVFRRETLRAILSNTSFANPNSLEDVLNRECHKLSRSYPRMVCYENSLITGVPVNIVNNTHGNRNGETHPRDPEDLNNRYLNGERLSLETFSRRKVTGAHTELALEFA